MIMYVEEAEDCALLRPSTKIKRKKLKQGSLKRNLRSHVGSKSVKEYYRIQDDGVHMAPRKFLSNPQNKESILFSHASTFMSKIRENKNQVLLSDKVMKFHLPSIHSLFTSSEGGHSNAQVKTIELHESLSTLSTTESILVTSSSEDSCSLMFVSNLYFTEPDKEKSTLSTTIPMSDDSSSSICDKKFRDESDNLDTCSQSIITSCEVQINAPEHRMNTKKKDEHCIDTPDTRNQSTMYPYEERLNTPKHRTTTKNEDEHSIETIDTFSQSTIASCEGQLKSPGRIMVAKRGSTSRFDDTSTFISDISDIEYALGSNEKLQKPIHMAIAYWMDIKSSCIPNNISAVR